MLLRLVVYLLLSLCCCAQAENLRLVTGDGYAPFTGRELPAGGLLTQVVHAALERAGVDSTLEWQPWNRAYLKTLRGDYDATFPYVRTLEREQDYLYSAPLLMLEDHIFSRTDDPIEQATAHTMQGRRACIPLGWQPPSVIQALLDQNVMSRHSPIGLKECALLVVIGRDDFFVADRRLGETALQLLDGRQQQVSRSHKMISSSSLHLIVPRNNPRGAAIIEVFNEGLASLRLSGGYQQVLESYIQARGRMASE
jgi:polar amino acid transport system substrate-binding protein